MTYLYTNPPLPALVSPVKYLWHGKVTSANRPLLQAVPVANGVFTATVPADCVFTFSGFSLP